MVTVALPFRAASSAASLTRLARSAPTKPEVMDATFFKSNRFVNLDVVDVNLEDFLAAADIGPIDQDVAVETPGPQKRGVERFRAGSSPPAQSRRSWS